MKKIYLLALFFFTLKAQSQNCWPATASIDIDINNIRAKLLNGGDMWWDGVSNAAYQYPKVDTSTGAIPKNVLFAGALWMSALDDQGNLKCAAQTYRNQGHDFWPGPITYGNSTISDVDCTNFDRFFPVLRTELDAHINAINATNSSLNTASIPANILQWPAKGNQYLLSQYNMDIVDDLAPFQDCNNNNMYDPENGDYPLMKGDQSIFWVINDIGNTHARTGGDPLGVEIQCMAYAYITNDAVNDATFYDYKIIKKTIGNLSDFYFSQFVDPDLLDFDDDYAGCDTTLEYGFCYNADNNNFGGDWGPILVTQFLNTNNLGLTAFSLFNNCGSGPQCDPDDAQGFRNFQTGLWSDGSPMNCTPFGSGSEIPTKFLFPGNPGGYDPTISACANMAECSNGNTPGDRRYLMTSGPYTLNATDALDFTIAVIIAPTPSNYNGCPDKDSIINPVVNAVNSFITNVNDNPYSCKVLSSIVDFNDESNLISIFPNPTSGIIIIKALDNFNISNTELYDSKGSLVEIDLINNSINLTEKAKGIYTLKIYNKDLNKIVLKKFVLR